MARLSVALAVQCQDQTRCIAVITIRQSSSWALLAWLARPPAGRTTASIQHYRGPTSSRTEKLIALSALPAIRVAPVNVSHSGANASGTKQDLPGNGCQNPQIAARSPGGDHESSRCGDGHDIVVPGFGR